MDIKTYTTQIEIELTQIGNPEFQLRLDGTVVNTSISTQLSPGNHCLEIEHMNKDATDSDTALIIQSITFNSITSPNFVWAGIYTPVYPEPWASSQSNLAAELTNTGYLGWNGVWRLEFTAPIFTWIHQVENLGWIYS